MPQNFRAPPEAGLWRCGAERAPKMRVTWCCALRHTRNGRLYGRRAARSRTDCRGNHQATYQRLPVLPCCLRQSGTRVNRQHRFTGSHFRFAKSGTVEIRTRVRRTPCAEDTKLPHGPAFDSRRVPTLRPSLPPSVRRERVRGRRFRPARRRGRRRVVRGRRRRRSA